jgi:hypothetical protein
MKSFTDLKTIDDIMYIVDGIKGINGSIKGKGGLGYKPYKMTGGMAIRDINNPDELVYELELEEEEEKNEEEKKADEGPKEYEMLRTYPLDDVLEDFTTERIVYELSSLGDLMAQIKQEGVKDYDKLYLNIIEDYDNLIHEVSRRKSIKNYTDKEKDQILSQYEAYPQEEADKNIERINVEGQKKFDNMFMALMTAGKKDQAKELTSAKNIKKFTDEMDRLKDEMNEKMQAANAIYNNKAEELDHKSLLAVTINNLKKDFDKIKSAKMKNKFDPATEAIDKYVNVNPLMKQIFNKSNLNAASELWDWYVNDDNENYIIKLLIIKNIHLINL